MLDRELQQGGEGCILADGFGLHNKFNLANRVKNLRERERSKITRRVKDLVQILRCSFSGHPPRPPRRGIRCSNGRRGVSIGGSVFGRPGTISHRWFVPQYLGRWPFSLFGKRLFSLFI